MAGINHYEDMTVDEALRYDDEETMGAIVTYGGGEDLEHRFIGSTPSILREPMVNFTGAARREQECRLWLPGNGHRQSWIALDDTAEFFVAACPMLYLVNRDTGISAADADALIEKMNGWT